MRRLYSAVAVLMTAAALTAIPLNRADAWATPGGCSGISFPFPSPTFPDICDVLPHLCKDKGPVVILADTIAAVGQSAIDVKSNAVHAKVGARTIIRRADQMMRALQVRSEVAGPTMDRIRQRARPRLDAVEAGQLTVGQLVVELGNDLIQAAEQGSTSYQQASTGSTTVMENGGLSGGFSVNLGIIEVHFDGQTGWEVSTTTNTTDDTGFTEECDDDGNCVCTEDAPSP